MTTITTTAAATANGTAIKKVVPICATAAEVRALSRTGEFTAPTAGQCSGYVQANLIILPSKYADDFRKLGERNPVPCPIVAESIAPGNPGFGPGVAEGIDIRTDVPGYNVYEDGKLVAHDIADIKNHWTDDSVAFLIGCSFTFEAALCDAGLTPRHIERSVNCPMYRSKVALMPSGVFEGSMVVSMRPYPADQVERVRDITRPYTHTHGEPVAWGWDACERLGIKDVHCADFGDNPEFKEGEVPVFWGCGVTPQLSVMESPRVQGMILGHAPGKMACLDLKVADVAK